MSKNDSRDVVGEAVDAVTLNQEVQWERCARHASPAEQRALETLRSLARIFERGHAAEDSSARAPATATGSFGGRFMRNAARAILTLAAVEVAAALLLLPWKWDAYHREHGDLAVYMLTLFLGHGASACLLLLAGRRDPRTALLGAYFLLKATASPMHMLPAFWGGMPPVHMLQDSLWELPPPSTLFLYLYGYPFGFAPAFLWAFARECPRLHRRTGLDDLARGMVPVCMALGLVLWGVLVALHVTRTVTASGFITVLDVLNAAPNTLSLAAVVAVALRAHTAAPAERRRVALFSIGFLLWMGWVTAYDVAEVFTPGMWGANYRSTPAMTLLQLVRFPGMVLLWYAVLTVRVPHPREVLRSGYRRLLARPALLAVMAAAPAVALGWLLVSRPEREVGAVLADPLVQSLLAAAGIMLLLVGGRERLLLRLDAWIYPEAADQRQTLAAAAMVLAKAERLTTVARTVTRAVKRGCGSPCTLLLSTDAKGGADAFRAPENAMPPLPRTSAIVHMLETGGGWLRVHPSDTQAVFDLLPAEEAAWVRETAADAIVPVPGPGAEVVGCLVVGRRFDDRIVRPADLPFLAVVASAAGQAVARLRLLRDPGAGVSDAPPALECPVCRYVAGAGEPPGCDCGPAYVEAEAPRVLAGKFRLTRRLGAGGMGAVYLARDVDLQRDIAVKTLAAMSGPRLLALKPEAWVMARVAHPGVAEIYGVESWRGRPFLLVEFLPGGTLADRLRQGPVPARQAVALVAAVAEALAALHRAGYLHGDVKPSNIGLTAEGLPKLLDFGLARQRLDAPAGGGTLRYLSPEVLGGQPAAEADDIWSLCAVLYEAVSGEHPFAGGSVEEVADRILRQRPGRNGPPATDSATASAMVAFAAAILTAARAARPATARAFADALRGLVGDK